MDARYIALAIPVFILLIGVELLLSFRRRDGHYRFHDMINSISCGVGQQVIGLAVKVAEVASCGAGCSRRSAGPRRSSGRGSPPRRPSWRGSRAAPPSRRRSRRGRRSGVEPAAGVLDPRRGRRGYAGSARAQLRWQGHRHAARGPDFFADGTKEAEQWVTCRLHELLAGRTAGALASTIRRHAASRVLDMASSVTLDTCIGYLVKHRTLLRYDRALAEGLPIATGVIEGACRHLVKDRMDRTGARWSLQGAEAVLRLRSLRSSGDFDAYWEFHLQQEHDRTHRARYAGGDVPSPLPAARPKLRRVK
jgi:hypothetical protein